GCLFGCSGVVLIVIVICGLLYFVGLPRFQNAVRDDLGEELSTHVARQVSPQISGAKLQPGEYRVSLDELQQQLSAGNDDNEVSGIDVRREGDQIVFRIQFADQKLEY